MLRKIRIQNYKSILDDTLELGRINVFIGENGCGKTNILEAVAMAGAALTEDLDPDRLFGRGLRLAKPSLTLSAFTNHRDDEQINLEVASEAFSTRINLWEDKDQGTWKTLGRLLRGDSGEYFIRSLRLVEKMLRAMGDQNMAPKISLDEDDERELRRAIEDLPDLDKLLGDFVIFNLGTLALRGLQSLSRMQPLGIYGEGLDTAIASLDQASLGDLTARASCVAWMEKIEIDGGDRLKLLGFKPGRGVSTLYFMDRFMAEENNIFSAENANEGILHILFYLTLFLHRQTPCVFGIDNIETALNPQLCRDLIKQLVQLSALHNKQALITTHNPATLDGLNLHDDEQRLFVVERNEEGHTSTRRVHLKPDAGDGQKYKLSELWMRGHLGGLPRGF